jgi:hypothetical protein
MFNAEEIKEIAVQNAIRLKKIKDPADILYKHFEEKVKEYAEKGAFEVKNIIFPIDRFKKDDYEAAVKKLKNLGFKIDTELNHAYQKVKFDIKW